jgi:hypothetical protein
MELLTTAGGSRTSPDPVTDVCRVPEAPARQHPEVLAWLGEARRLFAEAEDRLEVGLVLPALSSLAAVPPLHRMLVERCSELLDPGDDEAEEEAPPARGMYL